uniref:LEM domain-containing protein n=1 Tax=Meloidogyne hapla TaxID=6305 RepID=A0A1I8BT22_MELHA
MSEQFSHLSNEELRQELINNGITAGPIGATTRKVYEKRLEKKLAEDRKNQFATGRRSSRENSLNSSISSRNVSQRSFEGSRPSQKSFEGSRFFDDQEDDHTESSRIISPQRRFTGSYNKNLVGRKISPIDKFKDMGSSAWGFFSRSIGTSTPCSDFDYHNKYSTNKYRRSSNYVSSSNYAGVGSTKAFNFSTISDYSRWLLLMLFAVLAVISSTYIYKVHTETLHSAFVSIKTAAFFYGIYKLFQYRKLRKIEQKQTLIQLVERITDIIYESGFSGVAEPHVRDMLMPPTKRSNEDYKLWLEAARFINNEDSRVRTEIRLINGTECNVWIWIGAGKQRWQGTAVAEGSPSSRVPDVALSCCLKLRGLNFSDNRTERDCLRKELLEKMSVVPKHIDFVNNTISRESVVYLMLKDLNDAKKAFSALHSQWFDGNLITVKYIRDDRYAERFPGLK